MALCEDLTAVMNMSSMDGMYVPMARMDTAGLTAAMIALRMSSVFTPVMMARASAPLRCAASRPWTLLSSCILSMVSMARCIAFAVVIDIQATTAVFAAYGVDLAIEDDARMVD